MGTVDSLKPKTLQQEWIAVCSGDDVQGRQLAQSMVQGVELVVWRDDAGVVNAWENRCPHRGVRLSMGIHRGDHIQCQYHGWKYRSCDGACIYIPASPADIPPATIRARTLPCTERYGLVWVNLSDAVAPMEWPQLEGDFVVALKALSVGADVETVKRQFEQYRFVPSHRLDAGADKCRMEVTFTGAMSLAATADDRECLERVTFFFQPVRTNKTIVHAVLSGKQPLNVCRSLYEHHLDAMKAVRADVTRAAQSDLATEIETTDWDTIRFFEKRRLGAPVDPYSNPLPALRMKVARKWTSARDVAGVELAPCAGDLPSFSAGAHIDLHLPHGMIRQYSMVNAPAERERLVLGVKLEADSRGGSRYIHQTLAEGDEITVTFPPNKFALVADARNALLIAGGIGITPILAMAQELASQAKPFTLHYFARGEDFVAFPERLASVAGNTALHLALSPDATLQALRELLTPPSADTCVYVCGPGPLLQACRKLAHEAGWPPSQIRFEYFSNDTVSRHGQAFTLELARQKRTFAVPPQKTIVQVLREHGLDLIETSCEQGVCGTCVTHVVEGEPDHRDVYLSDDEKCSGHKLLACVSRAKSTKLVLDL